MAQIDMNFKRRISDVVIDMTSWKTGEVIKNQYPYTVVFKDDAGQLMQFSSAKIKSDGMVNLLDEMESRYKATPVDTTNVVVLCPKELLNDKTSPYSGKSSCTVHDLCEKGMDALDFYITSDKTIESRLETVLDCIAHRSCMQYNIDPKKRLVPFHNSIYRYDRIDNEHADMVIKNPGVYPVHEFSPW